MVQKSLKIALSLCNFLIVKDSFSLMLDLFPSTSSFHSIAPYYSHCQYHSRDLCSSAVCRHCHSPCVLLALGAGTKACSVCTLQSGYTGTGVFITQHSPLYQNHAKFACQKLLQLLEQQPQSGLWKSSCVPSASCIIFLIKVLKWGPAAILLLTHATKHAAHHAIGWAGGAERKTRRHSSVCEGLEWNTWDRVMSVADTQDLAEIFHWDADSGAEHGVHNTITGECGMPNS